MHWWFQQAAPPQNVDIIDDLSYFYAPQSNTLMKVEDVAHTEEFNNGNSGIDDYAYDLNGNLIEDKNKEIVQIDYNYLNLPEMIEFVSPPNVERDRIAYIYSAEGVKLQKLVITNNSATIVSTDYAGNYIYEDGVLKMFFHPGGYVEPVDPNDYSQGFSYVYQYKDHLGNVRLSYSDANGNGTIEIVNSEVLDEKNYYPFGLEHQGYNSVVNGVENNYQTYQGKEKEEELGLNTIAFGWRDYDPAIARFNKIDRFAEKYFSISPYAFTANNPIFFREIKGDSIEGVSRRSARRTRRAIRKTFRNNKKLARLFKTKGNKFKGISQEDFDNATQNSSDDEKALAQGYFDAVNSSEIHTVEAVKRGENLESNLSQINGFKTGEGVDNATGGGFNYGTTNGSHTVMVINSTIPITDYRDNSTGARIMNRTSSAGELLAHELLGHGLTRYNVGGNQFLNAIQLTNLYNRVTDTSGSRYRFYRDGSRHGGNPAGNGVAIPGTISWQVPLYLR